MKEKFTYFEFQMYILPGALFLSVILVIAWMFDWRLVGHGLDIFDSMLFILMSFILGNFLQTISHGSPEKRLKKQFWNGLYPSQRMFFPNNQVVNETMRKKFLKHCLDRDLLTQEDVEKCVSVVPDDSDLMGKIATAFDILRVSFENVPFGKRISNAEAHYLFFRGMFVASFWAGIIALIAAIVALVLMYMSNHGISMLINFVEHRIPAVMVTSLLGIVLWRTFRWRCRGTAQGFAREVVRATLSKAYQREREV